MVIYGGPKVHGNINLPTAQYQFAHGSFIELDPCFLNTDQTKLMQHVRSDEEDRRENCPAAS